MGSQCEFNIIAKATFDISLLRDMDGNKFNMGLEFKEGTVHTIHLHFPAKYTLTFYPDREFKTKLPRMGFFTLTCVADFCWFILMLNSEFNEVLQVAGARPDPIRMVLAVIERW